MMMKFFIYNAERTFHYVTEINTIEDIFKLIEKHGAEVIVENPYDSFRNYENKERLPQIMIYDGYIE
jgi:hypothetical protein